MVLVNKYQNRMIRRDENYKDLIQADTGQGLIYESGH